MQIEIVDDVRTHLDAIESAEAVLVRAVNADGMEGKMFIEAAIYIIGQAVPAVRGYLEAACASEAH